MSHPVLPEVEARLTADVDGFIRGWDRAAQAAERAAARIRAAQQGLGDLNAGDNDRFRDLDRELERLTRTARAASDAIRDFGNSSRQSGDDVNHLGDRSRDAADRMERLGRSGGGVASNWKVIGLAAAALASLFPAVAAAAIAAGAALQGLGVAGAVIAAGWKGIEQAGERLKNTLRGLQAQLESVFRSELSGEFQKLGQAIATLDNPLKGIARSISDVVKEFTGWIRSAQGMQEIEAMLGGVDNMIKSLAPGAKALGEVFTGFGAAAAPAMDEIGKALSSVFEQLNKVVQKGRETGQLEKAFQAGASAIDAFGAVLAGIVDILIEVAGTAGEPAADAIKKFGQAMSDAAPFIGTVFKILAGSMNILATVVGWFAKLLKAAEPLVRKFNEAADSMDKFVNSLDPKKIEEFGKAVTAFAAKLAVDIKKGVDEAVKNVQKWWEDTKKSIQKGVEDAIKNVKKWWDDTKKEVKKGVDDAIKNVKKWWDDTKKEVKKGVDNAIKEVKKWAESLAKDIKNGIDGFIKEVEKWWDDTVKEVEKGVENAVKEVEKLPEKALDALNPWAGDMEDAGKDAGEGLAEGLQSAGDKLEAVAKAIAAKALNAIKSALGIKSPSIVFRDEVGAMIPAGIADGIIANAGSVTDAMRRTGVGAIGAGRGAALGGAALGRSGAPVQMVLKIGAGADSAMGTAIAKLARTGQLKITANAVKS